MVKRFPEYKMLFCYLINYLTLEEGEEGIFSMMPA